jgi:hypothetical protein
MFSAFKNSVFGFEKEARVIDYLNKGKARALKHAVAGSLVGAGVGGAAGAAVDSLDGERSPKEYLGSIGLTGAIGGYRVAKDNKDLANKLNTLKVMYAASGHDPSLQKAINAVRAQGKKTYVNNAIKASGKYAILPASLLALSGVGYGALTDGDKKK